MKDALGQDIMAGDWAAYPGHQGSGRAYISVGVVVEARELTIRIVPYGRLDTGATAADSPLVEPHKSCSAGGLTRPFLRTWSQPGTMRMPQSPVFMTEQATAFRDRALKEYRNDGEPMRCPLCLGRGFIQSGDELVDGEYIRVRLCICYVADIHRRAKELKKDSERYMYLASDPLRDANEHMLMLTLRESLAARGVTFDWAPVPRDSDGEL